MFPTGSIHFSYVEWKKALDNLLERNKQIYFPKSPMPHWASLATTLKNEQSRISKITRDLVNSFR